MVLKPSIEKMKNARHSDLDLTPNDPPSNETQFSILAVFH